MKTKNELRAYYRNIRREMSDKENKDRLIFSMFSKSEYFRKFDNFFVYVSGEIEVDTIELISFLLKHNKSVAVPLCDTDKCTMEFYSISSFDDLESGAYGIYEPKKECLKITADENTVCIVPGLAFDKSGFRIGFGKGYYDRFLSEFKGESVGLCYDECFSDILIKDKFDMCVSAVITETCIYKTRQ